MHICICSYLHIYIYTYIYIFIFAFIFMLISVRDPKPKVLMNLVANRSPEEALKYLKEEAPSRPRSQRRAALSGLAVRAPRNLRWRLKRKLGIYSPTPQ